MIRIVRVIIFILTVCCLCLSCVQVRAQAQAGAEVPQETNLGIDAINASVHGEVGGLPQDQIPVDLSNQRASLQRTMRHSATAFWPSHEDILPGNREDVMNSYIVRKSCLTSATNYAWLDRAHPNKFDTTCGVQNHEEMIQRPFEFANHSQSHPAILGTKPSIMVETPADQNPDPIENGGESSPFGRVTFEPGLNAGLPSNGGFATHKDNFTGKRREHNDHKPAVSPMTKSPFDSTATTRQ
jgi:hypothetical protein